MDDRIAKLAKVCAASMRGEETDPVWISDQARQLLVEQASFEGNALWHTLVDAGRALHDVGEYALAGEIFEQLLEHARSRKYPKLEFDALEGLGECWFYLGDHGRAMKYLNEGLALAQRLQRKHMIERFESAIEYFLSGKPKFEEGVKAPTNTERAARNRKAHVSSLLKQQRNR